MTDELLCAEPGCGKPYADPVHHHHSTGHWPSPTAVRYIVLVWFHDHWAVSTQTNDLAEAESAFDGAQRHDKRGLCPILLDTHDLEATWTYTGVGS